MRKFFLYEFNVSFEELSPLIQELKKPLDKRWNILEKLKKVQRIFLKLSIPSTWMTENIVISSSYRHLVTLTLTGATLTVPLKLINYGLIRPNHYLNLHPLTSIGLCDREGWITEERSIHLDRCYTRTSSPDQYMSSTNKYKILLLE